MPIAGRVRAAVFEVAARPAVVWAGVVAAQAECSVEAAAAAEVLVEYWVEVMAAAEE
jgi:hypothetical protein